MKVLASCNIKGGVDKTAAAINLSYYASREGARTLIWDLDPQGAATFYLRVKPKIKGGGKALITQKRDIDSVIKASNYPNLDILPADFSYRNMDLVLDNSKNQSKRLLKLFKPLSENYDYVFLDCPLVFLWYLKTFFTPQMRYLSRLFPRHFHYIHWSN